MTLSPHRLTRISLGAAVLAVISLSSLHFLNPEFSSTWRMVSEYALGNYKWVLTVMFLSWSASGNLAQTLRQHNLVDEYILMIYPMALGQGKRLFQESSQKLDLELTKSKITKSGILVLTYNVKSHN